MADSTAPNPSTCTFSRSSGYYLDTVTFGVGNTLFKVPKYLFQSESSVFNDMFSLPESQNAEGLSDEKPIILEGVTEVDFERLLKVLYPLTRNTMVSRTQDEWTSILHLATMWRFKEIRRHAIQHLTPTIQTFSSFSKISLGQQFRAQSWFLQGLEELVQAKDTLSEDEWVKNGFSWQWAYRVSVARESCRAAGHKPLQDDRTPPEPDFKSLSISASADTCDKCRVAPPRSSVFGVPMTVATQPNLATATVVPASSSPFGFGAPATTSVPATSSPFRPPFGALATTSATPAVSSNAYSSSAPGTGGFGTFGSTSQSANAAVNATSITTGSTQFGSGAPPSVTRWSGYSFGARSSASISATNAAHSKTMRLTCVKCGAVLPAPSGPPGACRYSHRDDMEKAFRAELKDMACEDEV